MLSSCGNIEEVELRNVEVTRVNMTGSTQGVAHLAITVYNPTHSPLVLAKAQGALSRDKKHLANFRLLHPARVPGDGLYTETAQVEFELINLFSIFTQGFKFDERTFQNMLVDGQIKVRAGLASKNLRIKEQSVKDFVRTLQKDFR